MEQGYPIPPESSAQPSVIAVALNPSDPGASPLFVNRYAVGSKEFRWFMQQERATVFHYVKTNCGIDYGKDFWNHDCDGTTPKAMLQKRVIDRIVREKIQQLLFKHLGLIQDVDHSVFLKNLERLNANREQVTCPPKTVPV